MHKYKILDTSAIIASPDVLVDGFSGDTLILTKPVLDELDELKNASGNTGFNARKAMSLLESNVAPNLHKEAVAVSEEGSVKESGMHSTFLRIDNQGNEHGFLIFDRAELPHPDMKVDDYLAGYAVRKHSLDGDIENMSLVSQDRGVLVKSLFFKGGQDKESFANVESSERLEIGVDKGQLSSGVVEWSPKDRDIVSELYEKGNAFVEDDMFPVNTGVIIKNGSASALAIAKQDGELILADSSLTFRDFSPRGARQKIAANHLSGVGHDKVEILGSISGRAGSGKTALAVAAGLVRVARGEFSRVMVFRPTETVGRDLGFLPGTLEEKMEPWRAAINDIVATLGYSSGISSEKDSAMLEIDDILTVESVNHIRGRTFNNSFIIIDEAQNLEYDVLRTALSRLGEGSAAVLTWDASQVDNHFLKSGSQSTPEGLLKNLMPHPDVWNVTLDRPERGGISALIS